MRPRAAVMLLLAACMGPDLGTISSELTGLSRRTILDCMGPPDYLDSGEEQQVFWVFVRSNVRRGQDIVIEADLGGAPTHGRRAPTVVQGSVHQRGAVEQNVGFPTEGLESLARPGLCVLGFELRDQRVTDFAVVGRTTDNLNANVDCARLTRVCLEEPDATD